ncbi:MAG: hypothetical protein ACPL1Y_04330 [Thermoplasmata archaeon]
MYLHFSYHLHGYQPGDVIQIEENSPFEPVKFTERHSPLNLDVAGTTVYGRNWTDAVLNGYRLFPNALRNGKEKMVSIDIEPFTLQMYANKFGISSLLDLLSIFDKSVEFVATPPFHPPLSLMHRIEQEVVARIMWDIAFAISDKFILEREDMRIYGVWLPEALYTSETANIVANAFATRFFSDPHLRVKKPKLYFILDKRQFLEPKYEHYLYSLNYVEVADTKIFVFGRIPELSDIFAFNKADIPCKEFVTEMLSKTTMKRDEVKETEGIPYLVTLASDLESLVSNGKQVEKFRCLFSELNKSGIGTISISDYIHHKLTNALKR